MDNKQEIEKLENDLAHFLMSEIPRARTERSVVERQMYLYKGLNIYLPSKQSAHEKTVSIRIGALEAQYSLETGSKTSGALMPDDDHNVRIWLRQTGKLAAIKALYSGGPTESSYNDIVLFDLEEIFQKNTKHQKELFD